MEVVLAAIRHIQDVVVSKAAAVITTEETKVVKAIVPSVATRPSVTIDGAVISILTAGVTTRRPRNVSTTTTRMVPVCSTGTSTNQPADSPAHSQLGLAVAAEAVDEAVEDSRPQRIPGPWRIPRSWTRLQQ